VNTQRHISYLALALVIACAVVGCAPPGVVPPTPTTTEAVATSAPATTVVTPAPTGVLAGIQQDIGNKAVPDLTAALADANAQTYPQAKLAAMCWTALLPYAQKAQAGTLLGTQNAFNHQIIGLATGIQAGLDDVNAVSSLSLTNGLPNDILIGCSPIAESMKLTAAQLIVKLGVNLSALLPVK
jgi:hypothetical protein